MSIEISKINNQRIIDSYNWITAILTEFFPEVSCGAGAFLGYVVAPHAILLASVLERIDEVITAQSFEKVLEGGDYDSETLKNLLSNFGVELRSDSAANGIAYVLLTNNVRTTIYRGTQFVTPSGLVFELSETVIAVPEDPQEGEILIEPCGSLYRFPITLIASTPGSKGNIRQGTTFTCRVTIPYLYKIIAANDFSGGFDAESDLKSAVNRVVVSRASSVLGNNKSIMSLLKLAEAQENYSEFGFISALNVVGTNHPEMIRDQRSVFPISLGGKIDIYIKRHHLLKNLLKAEALLIGIAGGKGIWRIRLNRSQSKGVYKILAVYPKSRIEGESFEILNVSRDYDLNTTEYDFIPNIEAASEAVFSSFQTITFTFLDDKTSVSPEEINVRTETYNVVVYYAPCIHEVQKYLGSNNVRPPFVDILVKGAVPAWTTVNVTLSTSVSESVKTNIREAIYGFINTKNIGETIYLSDIVSSFSSYLPIGVVVKDVRISANIQGIDDSITTISNGSNLYLGIPTNLSKNISPRTVGWFVDIDSITIGP